MTAMITRVIRRTRGQVHLQTQPVPLVVAAQGTVSKYLLLSPGCYLEALTHRQHQLGCGEGAGTGTYHSGYAWKKMGEISGSCSIWPS
jgi:hypothetical protein